jgi:hypothetical protein
MSLTSSSSLSDAIGQLNNNLLWEGDSTKAQNALEAIRFILANRPLRIAEESQSMDYESLKDQAQKIEDYLGSSTTTVERTSFTRGRMLI